MAAVEPAPAPFPSDIPNDATAAAPPQPQGPKPRGCLGCCPSIQPHSMREAGGSRCLPPRVLFVWRLFAGVVLLVLGVLRIALKKDIGEWPLYFFVGATFLAMAVCSLFLADTKELVPMSSAAIFLHTFACTGASYFAPSYVYSALFAGAKNVNPLLFLGMLPFAFYVADVLVFQAQIAPPFVYGLPSLIFWYANLLLNVVYFRANSILVALILAAIASIMLFVSIGLTRIFGIRPSEIPDRRELHLEVSDDVWA